MQKKERHETLLSLINAFEISNQSDLAIRLEAEGIRVTQASVSRDLDELGVIKLNGRYCVAPKPIGLNEIGLIDLATAGDCLIVGKCASGLASAITVRIDSALIPEVVGTIAGDDTIFIAVKDHDSQKSVIKRITELWS